MHPLAYQPIAGLTTSKTESAISEKLTSGSGMKSMKWRNLNHAGPSAEIVASTKNRWWLSGFRREAVAATTRSLNTSVSTTMLTNPPNGQVWPVVAKSRRA